MSLRYFDVYNIWATFGGRGEMAGIPRGRHVDVHILRIYTRPDRLLQEAFKISEGGFFDGTRKSMKVIARKEKKGASKLEALGNPGGGSKKHD
jgi:hypothetical protein